MEINLLLKDFNVITGENWLMINRRRMSLVRNRINLIICVLLLAIIFSWSFNTNTDGMENKTIQFILILSITLLVCAIIFYKRFTEKGFIISKKGSEFIIDKKHIFNKETIVGIYLNTYITDAMDKSVTIKLKTTDNAFTLLRGLNEEKSEAISAVILNFLELPQSTVKQVYW